MRRLILIPLCVVAQISLSAGLTDCEQGKVKTATVLPHVPSQYRQCFASYVKIPTAGLDRAGVAKLVAEFRKSDVAKTDCGRGLLAWYDKVRVAYGRK